MTTFAFSVRQSSNVSNVRPVSNGVNVRRSCNASSAPWFVSSRSAYVRNIRRTSVSNTEHARPACKPRRSHVGKQGTAQQSLSLKGMVSDICLVAIWAAAIPGLMWLGAAGGF